ncbi:hypothetical protein EVAR_103609_1 [Eumeta japonica]|uniref:Uncharacterized protein n=1 Tax=Eumeta variegata TaxID=151549 RepID=A0A4C1Z8V9_EUMVA|nr:hypothetical protein EVAR_103609_1 [Eumeta japonica]
MDAIVKLDQIEMGQHGKHQLSNKKESSKSVYPVESSEYSARNCRSELAANDTLRRYYAPRPLLHLRRVPILCHCDAFVTNLTAAVSCVVQYDGAPAESAEASIPVLTL